MSGIAVKVNNVCKIFGDESAHNGESNSKQDENLKNSVAALMDVSFEVQEGETFVIMGLSGSGKSTLIRCINRLLVPSSGSIKIFDTDISAACNEDLIELRRTKISMVFQHYGLMPHRDVEQNVRLGLELRGEDDEVCNSMVSSALDLVGLSGWEKSYPHELSGGMRQRVGIARSLAQDTPVMLLDEPFSGLDPLIRNDMQDELIRLQSELHKTIIFVTHDLAEAVKLGDRIAIMRGGRIVQIGTPQEIIMQPKDDYVNSFTKSIRREDILTIREIMSSPSGAVQHSIKPKDALIYMRNEDLPVLILVDQDSQYLGTVTLDQALEALQADAESLVEFTNKHYKLSPDSLLKDGLGLIMSADYLIPVVEEDSQRLVGELCKASVATLLADANQEETQENILDAWQHRAIMDAVSSNA